MVIVQHADAFLLLLSYSCCIDVGCNLAVTELCDKVHNNADSMTPRKWVGMPSDTVAGASMTCQESRLLPPLSLVGTAVVYVSSWLECHRLIGWFNLAITLSRALVVRKSWSLCRMLYTFRPS